MSNSGLFSRTEPSKRRIERWLAVAISLFLAFAANYFVLGLINAPVEPLVDLDPEITFDDVRPSVGPALMTVLIVAAASITLATLLQLFNSRWSLPVVLFYFLAAKLSWVMSAFLPNYDGGTSGMILTVIQIGLIVLIFRTQGHRWFRLSL